MKKGFTLIELLIVISILGILAVVGVGAFRSSQMKGRDAQRKSDLKQLSNALELYYQDHREYPDAVTTRIAGCPSTSNGACDWGIESFTDGNTVYFKTVPTDPTQTYNYVYVVDSSNTKYKLFAKLENSQDKHCIKDEGTNTVNCVNPVTVTCGGTTPCNYAVTSTNTTAHEAFN
jgi:type II secretion system protein G